MEAKDTVMGIPETAHIYENGWLEYTQTHKAPRRKADLESYRSAAHDAAWYAQNKAQAEISFKAGYEEGVDAEGWSDGYQKGIREVVERINHSFLHFTENVDGTSEMVLDISAAEWQAISRSGARKKRTEKTIASSVLR